MAFKFMVSVALVGTVLLSACAAGVGDPAVGSQSDLARVCPALAIRCASGYRAQRLPNCNQICVPDEGAQCNTDADCGAVYCLSSPCTQPVCEGHACVLPPQPQPVAGQACGDIHCGAGQYCCNSSCGICAPIGSMCILIACAN